MTIDRLTGAALLTTVLCAGFAVWQWTAPADQIQLELQPPAASAPPPAAALGAALSHLTPVVAAPRRPDPQPAAQRALRLIGVMDTDQGRIAVIEAEGETLFLRPGETRAGVALIELDASLAVVDAGQGERRLSLGG
jgi:hypothetical protein